MPAARHARRPHAHARLGLTLGIALLLASGAACRGVLGIGDDSSGSSDDGGPSDDAAFADGGASATKDGATGSGGKDAATDGGGLTNHDAGTVCTESTCTVTTFQQGLYGPVGVAVDLTHVYWIEVGLTIPQADMFGQLSRLPKNSSCKMRSCYDTIDYQVIAGELEGQVVYDTRLALGQNDVCYTQSFNGTPQHQIRCFKLAGMMPEYVPESASGDVLDLWVTPSRALWVQASSTSSSTDGFVKVTSPDGGIPLLSGLQNPFSISGDDTSVYFTEYGDGGPTGAILTVGADGGAKQISGGRTQPSAVKTYGGYAYWLESGAQAVMRTLADGSGPVEKVAATDLYPLRLVVDASGVYFATVGAGKNELAGSVSHAPLTPGGTVTPMITNIDKVYDIAIDATSLYVASVGTNLNAGKIVRIDKVH